MRHNIVPILEVGEHTDNVTIMNLQLPPSLPLEDLRLDLTRLEKAMHWGGIKLLALGTYEGDTTTYSPAEIKTNPDGTISATKAKIGKRARISNPQSQNLEDDVDFRWRNTAIYFNKPEIEERDTQDTQAQLKMLDRSLRTALMTDIIGHEISAKNIFGELKYALTASLIAKYPLRWHEDWGTIMTAFSLPKPPLVAIQYISSKMRNPLTIRTKANNLKPKYSTMFEYKIDRVTLASRFILGNIISLDQSAVS